MNRLLVFMLILLLLSCQNQERENSDCEYLLDSSEKIGDDFFSKRYHNSCDYQDSLIEVYFSKNSLHSVKYKTGDDINGYFIFFYESGDTLFKGKYIMGKKAGEHVTFYENGQISTVQNFVEGEQVGATIKFDSLGKELPSDNNTVRPFIP